MQKVFEKIIEKIEKERAIYFLTIANTGDKRLDVAYEKVGQAIDKSIEIVKQAAEKFGTDTNVGSNGWIPCSERLPEEGGYYLVTYHGWSNGDYLPKFDDTYVRRLHYQKSERFTGWNHPRYCDDKAENDTNKEVIAWQPLPLPFRDKE